MSDSLYVELDDLAILFGYKNRETARKAIYSGAFPIHVFKLRGSWVAEREVVKAFFRKQREEAHRKLEAHGRKGPAK